MLGHLRFVFAWFVVVTHLFGGSVFVSHWGVFAVFGFYLVSGYLMTVVLHETYGFNCSAFVLNRLLRIYPVYYVVLGVSALVVMTAPHPETFHMAWTVQVRFVDLACNVMIVPFAFCEKAFRLIPPTWSIAVELINYLLLWLIIARNKRLAVGAAMVSLAYHVGSLALGAHWRLRYEPFYAAILPFSLGACLYFWRSSIGLISEKMIRGGLFLWGGLWLTNLLCCSFGGGVAGVHFNTLYYTNLLLLVGFVACMIHPSSLLLFRKTGKITGDLAYPIFLTHWLVGFIVHLSTRAPLGPRLLACSVVPILLISYVLVRMTDIWVEPIRNKIRVRELGKKT